MISVEKTRTSLVQKNPNKNTSTFKDKTISSSFLILQMRGHYKITPIVSFSFIKYYYIIKDEKSTLKVQCGENV